MKMRTFIGLCAALAFAAGSTAVHAIKFLDSSGGTFADGVTSVTYAMETLLKGADNVEEASDETDKTTYYQIARQHFVSGLADIASTAGDTYLVTYALDGMVFSEAAATINSGLNAVTGGGIGDRMAVYRTDGVILTTAQIELTARFAVSEGGGSITRTLLNRSLEGIPGVDSAKTDPPISIKIARALKEDISPAVGIEAKAVSGFTNFGINDDDGKAIVQVSLGSIVLGVVSKPANLRDAQGTSPADSVDSLEDITAEGRGADSTEPHTNPVTFSGDFSFATDKDENGEFAEIVGLGVGDDCGELMEIRVSEGEGEDAVLTNETMAREALTFMADVVDNGGTDDVPYNLCVVVDGKSEITEVTEDNAFTVMAVYKGIDDAAFPPKGAEHALGLIGRDGASFHIPYLTVNDAYNQRVIIVNRGGDTTYSFGSFQAADGGMVEPGDEASGDLPKGQMVLRSNKIVKVTDGNVASATLSIVADKGTISAAVQQRHLMEGTVDTVYLD